MFFVFAGWHKPCNLGGMANERRSGFGRSDVESTPSRRLISRFAPILNRPLAIGAITVLASFLCCGALAETTPVSEGKPHADTAPAASMARHHTDRDDAIPLLFLLVLGLGGLALSQTKPTERPGQRAGSFCAGKNVVHGQELPAIIPPQPPLAVVARKHHDDVVGLQPVGAFRMLNQ
jgi:hypothetical protein